MSVSAEGNRRPLDGITVVDLTIALAGPACTTILADYGARVIKVEGIKGDATRGINSTKWMEKDAPIHGGDAFLSMNRNKEGICVDYRSEAGKKVIWKMLETADIMVSNFRPGTIEAMGYGYEEVHKVNPKLVWAQITAFPPDHPNAKDGGMDVVIQARAGTIACTGLDEDHIAKPGPSISDIAGCHNCTEAIMMALYNRSVTGKGQKVMVSLFNSTLQYLQQYVGPIFANDDYDFKPTGLGHPELVPCQAYKTKDSWVFITCGSQKLWVELTKALGVPEMGPDERFATNSLRRENHPELDRVFGEIFMQKTTAEWDVILSKAGVPNAPIISPRTAVLDTAKRGSQMFIEVEHPTYGKNYCMGFPFSLSDTPARIDRHAPRMGENTVEILKEYGFDESEVDSWENAGVINQFRA